MGKGPKSPIKNLKLHTVEPISFPGTEELIRIYGLGPGGRIQKRFSDELLRVSDPYVPADDAEILKSSAFTTEDGCGIVYVADYARVHWYGKVMVGVETGRAWAAKDEKKVTTDRDMVYRSNNRVPTDRDMVYQGAPMRGPKWVERAWLQNKDTILETLNKEVNR